MRTVLISTSLALLSITPVAAQLAGPSLILVDSLTLQEDEEHYVSMPLGVTIGPDGDILISDGFANAVFQFDRDGRFVRSFGRPGQGPGEFMGVGPVVASPDFLGAIDLRGMAIEVFDYRTGRPLGALPLRPQLRISALSVVGDSIWITGMEQGSWMSVGTIALQELLSLVRSGSKNQHAMRLDRIGIPAPYRTNPVMFGVLGDALFDLGPSSDMVVAFAGTPFLLRIQEGASLDTLHLDPRLRRGAPAEEDVSDPLGGFDPRTFANEISVLSAVSRDEFGNIIVTHTDLLIEDMQVKDMSLYVSSISADGSLQCADTPVPLSGVGSPRAILQGDQLLVVDQTPIAGDEVVTALRWFEVDASTCDGQISRK